MQMPTKTSERPGWVILVAGAFVNMCLGTVYSWSVFRHPLEQALGLTSLGSGLPYTIFLAAYAFSMPLGGRMVDRLGYRTTLLIGTASLVLGWVTAGFAPNATVLALGYGLLGGLGVGIAYGVPLNAAGAAFPTRRGLAMGIVLGGFGLSPFLTAPIAEVLVETVGVFPAFRVLGIAFAAILIALSFLFSNERRHTVEAAATDDLRPAQMVRRPVFYLLWATYALGTLVGLAAIGMTSTVGTDTFGLSARTAAITVSVFAVFNGIGRPLFGAITDRIGPPAAGAAAGGVALLGSLAVAFGDTLGVAGYVAGFALLWLSLGAWLSVAPAANVRFFGSTFSAANYGVLFSAYGVGALVGSPVASLAARLTGTPVGAFGVLAGAAALSVISAILLGRVSSRLSAGVRRSGRSDRG